MPALVCVAATPLFVGHDGGGVFVSFAVRESGCEPLTLFPFSLLRLRRFPRDALEPHTFSRKLCMAESVNHF